MPDFDVIVMGAGHNALVTAAYAAKAGLKVGVFERRHIVGGAVSTGGATCVGATTGGATTVGAGAGAADDGARRAADGREALSTGAEGAVGAAAGAGAAVDGGDGAKSTSTALSEDRAAAGGERGSERVVAIARRPTPRCSSTDATRLRRLGPSTITAVDNPGGGPAHPLGSPREAGLGCATGCSAISACADPAGRRRRGRRGAAPCGRAARRG